MRFRKINMKYLNFMAQLVVTILRFFCTVCKTNLFTFYWKVVHLKSISRIPLDVSQSLLWWKTLRKFPSGTLFFTTASHKRCHSMSVLMQTFQNERRSHIEWVPLTYWGTFPAAHNDRRGWQNPLVHQTDWSKLDFFGSSWVYFKQKSVFKHF